MAFPYFNSSFFWPIPPTPLIAGKPAKSEAPLTSNSYPANSFLIFSPFNISPILIPMIATLSQLGPEETEESDIIAV